ncbi:MAG: RDD family protein [Acidobacteriota bacterium]|jgi:uncharacterized RDD family membrane protein YckC|nr:RDD family protein [Acidobacteriota bacterium]
MDDNNGQSEKPEQLLQSEDVHPDTEQSEKSEKSLEEQQEEQKKEDQKQALKSLKNLSRPKFHPAGFWRRVAAFLLDAILPLATMGILYGLSVLITPDASETAHAVGLALGTIVGIVVFWLYNAVSESGYRQATPGKAALSIRIVSLSDDPLSFDRTTGRNFGKFISALILGIGFLMCLFTKEKQCLHDKMVDCLVVRDDRG